MVSLRYTGIRFRSGLSHIAQVLKLFKETTDILCSQVASLKQVISLICTLDQALEYVPSQGYSLLPQTRAFGLEIAGRPIEAIPSSLSRQSVSVGLPQGYA